MSGGIVVLIAFACFAVGYHLGVKHAFFKMWRYETKKVWRVMNE